MFGYGRSRLGPRPGQQRSHNHPAAARPDTAPPSTSRVKREVCSVAQTGLMYRGTARRGAAWRRVPGAVLCVRQIVRPSVAAHTQVPVCPVSMFVINFMFDLMTHLRHWNNQIVSALSDSDLQFLCDEGLVYCLVYVTCGKHVALDFESANKEISSLCHVTYGTCICDLCQTCRTGFRACK